MVPSQIFKSLYRDNDKVALLALLDLSAAFDTIDHSILLSRLQTSFGVSGTVLSWFQSYLLDRSQTVCVKGASSKPSVLSFGVMQGYVLGPMLFVLYASPVSDVISRHAMSHESFADDTQVDQSAPIDEIGGLMARTRECFSDLKVWMTQNKLQLSDEKTEFLLVAPRNFSIIHLYRLFLKSAIPLFLFLPLSAVLELL